MPPAVIAALIGAGGAAATTLGVGSGSQDIRGVGPPGNVDRVAGQFEELLRSVLQGQSERRNAPVVFPGNRQAFNKAAGGARIAGLPTGTVGRNPALSSFLRRRQVSLDTGGGIGDDDTDGGGGSGGTGGGGVIDGGGKDPDGGIENRENQVLMAIQAILEQNRGLA